MNLRHVAVRLAPKDEANRGTADAKALSDSCLGICAGKRTNLKYLLGCQFRGWVAGAPSLVAMVRHVWTDAVHHLNVFRSVVKFVAVDVMDDLAFQDRPAVLFLGHQDCSLHIPIGISPVMPLEQDANIASAQPDSAFPLRVFLAGADASTLMSADESVPVVSRATINQFTAAAFAWWRRAELKPFASCHQILELQK